MKTKTLKLIVFFITFQFIGIQLNAQCVTCDGGSATGTNSSIIGLNNTASGNNSFAGGKDSRALGLASIAYGDFAYADGLFSVALGKEVQAFGGTSVAIGRFLKTSISSSMVIGYGLNSPSTYLNNDKEFSMMMGFNSNVPTFFVSSSNGAGTTGKIGIGNVTNPSAKLHIKADANEDASIFLETSSNDQASRLMITNEHTIEARNEDNLYFGTAAGKDFVFHQGDIFLDDIQSGIIMKSPNGLCWRGTLNEQGTLTFVEITCPEETNVAVQSSTGSAKLKLYPNPTSGKLIVETNCFGHQAALILRDTEGKIVVREAVYGSKTEINLNHISSGMYIIQLVQNYSVIADEKVVVE
jgi:hypothetical protein